MSESLEIRLDRATMPKFERTPEGYLRGRAVVSRIGVLKYLNADGSSRFELRHPEDVLSQASLDSLKQIPITMDHPSELVNSDNVAKLAVGYTGDDVKVDGNRITVNFTVTHADAIAQIEAGKRELSLGYRLNLKSETGNYDGQDYTHRQVDVTYNHLAIVAKARAGAEARIHLDGASVLISADSEKDHSMSEKTMAAVNLDGITYDAAPEVAKALTKETARADKAEGERTDAEKARADAEKERDELQARLDTLQEEIDGMKESNNDAAVQEAAKARVALLTQAGKLVNTDSLADKTPREIMEAAIKARNDKLDLSEKSDDYIVARFDAAIEAVDAGKAHTKKEADKMGARADALDPPKEEKDHRADMADSITNMWKRKTEKGAA